MRTNRIRLLAIAGSTGSRSLSSHVAQLCLARAKALFPSMETAELPVEFQRMPILNVDHYRTGELFADELVRRLRAECAAADALVLVTPVQHGSFSGALKNVLDHLPSDAFRGKPVFIAVQAAGLRGSQSARDHLHAVIRSLGGWSTPTSLVLENADHSAGLSPDLISRIDEGLAEAVRFCRQQVPKPVAGGESAEDVPWPLDVPSRLHEAGVGSTTHLPAPAVMAS